MSTNLISFPFRLSSNGTVVTLPDDGNEYYAEEIAVLVLTRPEERPLVPTFGLNDPTYDQVDPQELAIKVAAFRLPFRIVSVDTKFRSEYEQDVVVSFVSIESGAPFAARVPITETEG